MSMGSSGNVGSEVSNMLVQGFKAAKEGRRDEAYNLFCEVVRRDPNNELGWLYRAATTDDLSEAYVCLQRVLSINPNNEKAQRGVERIQARLNSEEETANLPHHDTEQIKTAGGVPMMGNRNNAHVGERDVVSGLSSAATAAAAAAATHSPDSQPTSPYAYDEAAAYRQSAPSQLPNVPASAPPPYRPDFENPRPFDNFNQGRPSQTPDYEQGQESYPGFMNQGFGGQDQDYGGQGYGTGPDEMVDEPFEAAGSARGRSKEAGSRTGGLAGLRGGLVGARQRGRAAFGTESGTDLDPIGRERARRVQLPLILAGIALVLIALVVFFVVLTSPKNTASQQAANPTDTASAAVTETPGAATATAGTTVAGATRTPAVAVSVPVVGGTATAAATTAATTAVTAAVGTQTTPAPTTAGAAATTAAAPTATLPGTPPRAAVYTVKSGDNLTRIANQFSTSIAAIQAANPGVNPNRIFAGNQLVVPVQRPDYRGKGGVILKPGETIQTLADRFKVSADDIARFNGLANPADAKTGDAILIP